MDGEDSYHYEKINKHGQIECWPLNLPVERFINVSAIGERFVKWFDPKGLRIYDSEFYYLEMKNKK